MEKVTEKIPEDIAKVANELASTANTCCYRSDGYEEEMAELIARAILAERERCAKVASNFIDNVEIEVEGRSRFSIYDLNREAKKAVRYVKDQITGEFDDNWISK